MRIVFMGTPDFAAVSLRALHSDGFDVAAAFTQPDKPKNRGMKLIPTPVKQAALELGIPVYQPQKLRDGSAAELLRSLEPDIIAVVAYGRILPKDILDIPKFGCVNIHGSLLPKYRGSAPVQWALLNGDRETGVCAIYMAEDMDAGDIIAEKRTEIGEAESFPELYERLARLGAELLCETVSSIADGTAKRAPQEHEKATYAPMITRELSPVDWRQSAWLVRSKILGLDPWPGATSRSGDAELKLFRARCTGNCSSEAPGSVVSTGKEGVEVACGDGKTVLISELQAPGGKRMRAADYLRGHKIAERFELPGEKE
ncbi:MAG: methionyl-tRNA formyltransferase [Oscillospiraceae bacterium]|nr:methionyl-tRNA formyltransferase [Oscillospiraceae bacterium]